jgi:hypothetical protein
MTTLRSPSREVLEEASAVLRMGNIYTEVSSATARCAVCRASLRSKYNPARGTKCLVLGVYGVDVAPYSLHICHLCAAAIGQVGEGIQVEATELGGEVGV